MRLLLIIAIIAQCSCSTTNRAVTGLGVIATAVVGYLVIENTINKSEHRPEAKYVDPRLESYLAEFIKEAESRKVKIDLNHISLTVGKVSNERYFAEAYPSSVIFNEDKFDTYKEDFIRFLMFHELGHSLFSLDHTTNQQDIMASGGIATGRLKLSEVERIDELFSISKPITPTK